RQRSPPQVVHAQTPLLVLHTFVVEINPATSYQPRRFASRGHQPRIDQPLRERPFFLKLLERDGCRRRVAQRREQILNRQREWVSRKQLLRRPPCLFFLAFSMDTRRHL